MSLYGLEEKIKAPELAPDAIVKLANRVRAACHEGRLDGAEIRYLVEPGEGLGSGNRVELGRARRVPKIYRAVLNIDFLIAFNWNAWQELTGNQREALLDHELTHCEAKIDKNGDVVGWRIRKHDVEEFVDVLERRGAWKPDLEAAGKAIQKTLFDEPAEEGEADERDERRCSACGKTVDVTISLEANGRKTKPLCEKCFSKVGRTVKARRTPYLCGECGMETNKPVMDTRGKEDRTLCAACFGKALDSMFSAVPAKAATA